jgi:5-hydroxyisourate hydrolase
MSQAAGYLSTHVLDTVRGLPAAGVEISLYSIKDAERSLVKETTTNEDGRTDSPLIPQGEMEKGLYELVFDMGPYFERHGMVDGSPFLGSVPVRFRIDDESMHYHVPLLAAPFSYSTYRGS